MIIDLARVESIIADIAESEIASRFGKLTNRDIRQKSGPNDLVTEADRAAEHALSIALRDIYPAAQIIGEEGVAQHPARLEALNAEGAFWIIDPLDGTRNFVDGHREFGTIVALVENGEIRAGWIYAILEQKFASASLGDGVRWNNIWLESAIFTPKENYVGYRAIGNLREPWKSSLVPVLKKNFVTEPARCSAYVYINLLRAQRDFAIYSRCSPWDHAAGVMMLREVGGEAAYMDTCEGYEPIPTQGRPLLMSGSEDIHHKITRLLIGKTR